MNKIVNVVVVVLCNGDKILLNSRPIGKPMAGYWEFPGGKIEESETFVDAAIRELNEELGIIILDNDCKHIDTIYQDYEHASVCLEIVKVNNWVGDISALENQEISWQIIGGCIDVEPLLPTTKKIIDILLDFQS